MSCVVLFNVIKWDRLKHRQNKSKGDCWTEPKKKNENKMMWCVFLFIPPRSRKVSINSCVCTHMRRWCSKQYNIFVERNQSIYTNFKNYIFLLCVCASVVFLFMFAVGCSLIFLSRCAQLLLCVRACERVWMLLLFETISFKFKHSKNFSFFLIYMFNIV